jgi:hypothetical protein
MGPVIAVLYMGWAIPMTVFMLWCVARIVCHTVVLVAVSVRDAFVPETEETARHQSVTGGCPRSH